MLGCFIVVVIILGGGGGGGQFPGNADPKNMMGAGEKAVGKYMHTTH